MKRLPWVAVALLISGCGIPSTGVVRAGEPATGITAGLRIYFVSDGRLRGMPDDRRITNLAGAIKLLQAGPETAKTSNTGAPAAQSGKLISRLVITGSSEVAGRRGSVTVNLPETDSGQLSGLAMGQLVCTLASADSVLYGGSPADVEVTIKASRKRDGPYLCSQFRTE